MAERLERAGELSKETVFIDGTKLEVSANKYTFVWKKSVGKWEEKMFRKIQDVVQLLNHEYIQDFSVGAETRGIWNCSAGFWNGRLFMTGTRQVFRDGTITARQIRMPLSCT